jgi:hypothetical protein
MNFKLHAIKTRPGMKLYVNDIPSKKRRHKTTDLLKVSPDYLPSLLFTAAKFFIADTVCG